MHYYQCQDLGVRQNSAEKGVMSDNMPDFVYFEYIGTALTLFYVTQIKLKKHN